ncbi:MAG TPA: GAF domain-containing SpoIIE family protein phosphatase [Vicinamibacteria bacterium]|nr:GAF domain-containing SpoIIE family protein phosphatase [Vicinamibacteria bacterium]
MPASDTKTSPAVAGQLLGELLPIVAEISGVLDPEELLPAIARQLRRIVDYRILDIFLPEKDGTLVPAYVEGYDALLAGRLRIRPGEGIVGTAAAQREPVFVADVSRDARYLSIVPGVRAELAIPLIHRDRLVGVLNVEGPDASAYHPEARAALFVLAGHLAVAIENATLYRETRRYAGLLAMLYEIGKETSSILDLDELLQRVAEVVKRVIDYEMFGILLLDEEKGELVLRKAVSYGATKEKKTRIKLGEGLTGTAAVTKQPILVGDVQSDRRYLPLIPETRSELVVPLVHKDRVVGVFDLESSVLDRFTHEHLEVLTPLASQVAVAIENARLYETLARQEARVGRELELAQWIQQNLFPDEPPQGEGWDASAHFLPATELGGDLYDFFELGEGVLGLAVGDVLGKGVPAALFGAFVSGSIRARAMERRAPGDLMTRVNRTLRKRGAEGFYCTVAFAVFDFPGRRMVLANSGLPYPLLYRAATRRAEAIELPGLPLGTFDGSNYEERTVSLAPGDVVVFYTDGLTEARRADGEDYGTMRLSAQVEAAGEEGTAAEIGERLLSDVDAFLGEAPRADDLTLVVVKVR